MNKRVLGFSLALLVAALAQAEPPAAGSAGETSAMTWVGGTPSKSTVERSSGLWTRKAR